MRVVKVLNNSLVLALDEAGQETILMGKGIGYHKSIGYQFQESEIEKVFVLKRQGGFPEHHPPCGGDGRRLL